MVLVDLCWRISSRWIRCHWKHCILSQNASRMHQLYVFGMIHWGSNTYVLKFLFNHEPIETWDIKISVSYRVSFLGCNLDSWRYPRLSVHISRDNCSRLHEKKFNVLLLQYAIKFAKISRVIFILFEFKVLSLLMENPLWKYIHLTPQGTEAKMFFQLRNKCAQRKADVFNTNQ